ncbi:ABC transporter permease [Trueperella abortisuis]|nr:ABC transporter permease [Trueperella abortisuis]MCI7305877.1 ABC transporter permease [Trueperella sp.]
MLVHVMKREFTTMARSKAMVISIAIMAVLILVAGFAARYFNSTADEGPSASDAVTIAVEEQMGDYLPYLDKAGAGFLNTELIDTASAESYLEANDESGEGYAAVLAGEPGKPTLVVDGSPAGGVNPVAANAANLAATAYLLESKGVALSDADYGQLAASVSVTPQFVSFGSGGLIETDPVGYFTSLIGIMILFMMIMMGMTTIANGVVQEKSSRVVEILLTTIRPRTLLLGKVLGIGAFLLVQFAVLGASIYIALQVAGIDFSINIGSFLGWMLVWLLLGFFFYAMLMGAFASLASRQEDLGAVTMPLSLFMLVPFYLALFLVPAAPDSVWTKVLSFVPGFSPFVIPVRQAYGTVPVAEMAIAAVIGVVAIPLVAMLAGKIYSNSILHTGKRLSLIQGIRGR